MTKKSLNRHVLSDELFTPFAQLRRQRGAAKTFQSAPNSRIADIYAYRLKLLTDFLEVEKHFCDFGDGPVHIAVEIIRVKVVEISGAVENKSIRFRTRNARAGDSVLVTYVTSSQDKCRKPKQRRELHRDHSNRRRLYNSELLPAVGKFNGGTREREPADVVRVFNV